MHQAAELPLALFPVELRHSLPYFSLYWNIILCLTTLKQLHYILGEVILLLSLLHWGDLDELIIINTKKI